MKTHRFFAAALFLFAAFVLTPQSVSAKDDWLQVRSKNFYLIGNASEKDIRKVATKLEQFRETFRQVFARAKLDAPIPTNVVVFKSDSSYKPFKPIRADGKTDNFIAGYFQPGEDVNYITLSVEGEDADTYGTIFHEYVHFIIETNFGKSEVPPWFNEGLAEYYQSFAIEEDQKVKLGLPQNNHLALLQQNKLIPLDTLFKISNYALLQNANHSRSIFYAEAWALIHYLVQSGKAEGLDKFLGLVLSGVPPEKAFQDAFQIAYADMEKELKKYVGQNTYKYNMLTFKNKLVFDNEMSVSPLGEAESNAYLGDLLYHTNRPDDAEVLLQKTLALSPDSSIANTTLGMVKIRQRKFDDAKKYLEKAIAGDQKNHLALYRYAYLLSRDGRDEFGYVASFPKESTAKMRDLLKKAIVINPSFTESYELFAFISLVNNEEMDEAARYLQKALKYQPGNQRYTLRLAEIIARQGKYAEAAAMAEKLAKTAGEADIKSKAENLLSNLRQREEQLKQYETAKANFETSGGGRPVLRKVPLEKEPTLEEMEKRAAEANLVSINQALRKPAVGETRVMGHILNVSCAPQPVVYTIKTDAETFKLSSKDFQGLSLNTFDSQIEGSVEVGCDAKISSVLAVLTYKPKADARKLVRGQLVAVEFVPKSFRMMDEKEIESTLASLNAAAETSGSVQQATGPQITVVESSSEPGADPTARRREAMLSAMKAAMRKPATGEKQVQGFIDHTECGNKGTFFVFKTASLLLKLSVASPESVQIRAFTPDMEQVQIGCGMKNIDIPVVVTYKDAPNAKAKTGGELVSLEFMPANFVLRN
jgi:Tfp pilus assembly protein PilF